MRSVWGTILRPLVVLAMLMAVALGPVSVSGAITPTITTYPSSDPVSSSSHPYAVAGGSDGQIWFTDPYADKIGRMTVEGRLTLQQPTPASSFQYDITAGNDGAMWFVAQNPSTVNRIDGSGTIESKPLADELANPTHIVSGPDDALWFTESAGRKIGRIPATTPLATPDESRSTDSDNPNAIASGPDGNLWYTAYSNSLIGRMTPSGTITRFPLPSGIANPLGIATGPDGALWYTALNPATVVRITTDGTQKPYSLPADVYPGEITAGPDGALWFDAGDSIGRITTDGAIEIFARPSGVGVVDISAGPDGNVWFTEANAGNIGRITTPPNARTGNATGDGPDEATVTGTVNGHSQPTDVTIEYAPTDGATTATAAHRLGASAADQPVSFELTGLSPDTTYRYRVVATNGTGTTAGAFATFTTTSPLPPRLSQITNLAINPSRLVAAKKGPSVKPARRRRGAIVSYTSSENATTTFTAQRRRAGRRQGGKCVKPNRRNRQRKRCARWVKRGSFDHAAVVGANRFRFTGRVNARKLKPGRYRLRAIPRNEAGLGAAAFRKFRVVRR